MNGRIIDFVSIAKSCEVKVVPTLAPIIIPRPWVRLRNPALTNPTTITVTRLLLCKKIVVTRPSTKPLHDFEVYVFRRLWNKPPVISLRLLLTYLIPKSNKNIARTILPAIIMEIPSPFESLSFIFI